MFEKNERYVPQICLAPAYLSLTTAPGRSFDISSLAMPFNSSYTNERPSSSWSFLSLTKPGATVISVAHVIHSQDSRSVIVIIAQLRRKLNGRASATGAAVPNQLIHHLLD